LGQFWTKDYYLSIGIYCSFPFSKSPAKKLEWGQNSYNRKTAEVYLNCLVSEIRAAPQSARAVSTALWGAGDWSLVSTSYLRKLNQTLKDKFRFRQPHEFTIETSPAEFNQNALEVLKQIGVNRLSLNLYRFDLKKLKRLIFSIRKSGLDNLNFDLYFGQPGQNLKGWKRLLAEALSLNPTHVSLYSWGQGKPRSKLKQRQYGHALDFLAKENYRQYEICHFCFSGFQSHQNLLCWKRKNHLGFGLSAEWLWAGVRFKNVSDLEQYVRKVRAMGRALAFQDKLNHGKIKEEEIYFALRQTRGLDLTEFRKKYGEDLVQARWQLVNRLIQEGYLTLKPNRLALTKEGSLLADDLISKLF
jgi:oxygen-independent coproporphyrinogen-3 oxidase